MRKWLIGICLILLLGLAFLPQIASTSLGKPFFTRELEKKSRADAEIGSLKFSWFGPQIFQNVTFKKENITGSFEELQIEAPFWKFSGPFRLKNGQVAGQIEKVEGEYANNHFSLTGLTLNGHISLKGEIYSKLQFHIQIDVEKFPLIVLDQKLDQILGPTLDLLGSISMDGTQGTIDLKITSANLDTKIKGNLLENGITLNEVVNASIRLTPKVSALLLKDVSPLFITGLSAQNPVQLKIEPSGFFFPFPFSLTALKIGKATLDLGKVRCQNGESLSSIVSLLKADVLAHQKEMDIWFTPVSFQMSGGLVKTGRLDALLANSLHICTWGNIDLVKDKLNMILGIPSDTLQKSFGIQNLPPNYVLKIEVKGTTESPDINRGKAAAQIAALIASGQISKKGILRSITDLVSKKQDSDIPPPNRPFPWEKK